MQVAYGLLFVLCIAAPTPEKVQEVRKRLFRVPPDGFAVYESWDKVPRTFWTEYRAFWTPGEKAQLERIVNETCELLGAEDPVSKKLRELPIRPLDKGLAVRNPVEIHISTYVLEEGAIYLSRLELANVTWVASNLIQDALNAIRYDDPVRQRRFRDLASGAQVTVEDVTDKLKDYERRIAFSRAWLTRLAAEKYSADVSRTREIEEQSIELALIEFELNKVVQVLKAQREALLAETKSP